MLEQNKLNCCCSITKSCLTLCDPMDCSTPGSSTISQSLLKFMSIVSVMLSNHLILCYSLLLLPSIFPSIRVFSNEPALCIRWPNYWSLNFIINPSSECSGLICFRIDWFDLLAVQRTLKSLLRHPGLKASMARVLELQFQHLSPSNEYSELILFKIDQMDLFAVQGTLKSLFQHHSSKASFPASQFIINSSVLSFLCSPPLTSIHDC